MKDSDLLEAVKPAPLRLIWEYDPQGLATTTWVFATLVVEDSELLEALRPAAIRKTWKLTAQELANTA